MTELLLPFYTTVVKALLFLISIIIVFIGFFQVNLNINKSIPVTQSKPHITNIPTGFTLVPTETQEQKVWDKEVAPIINPQNNPDIIVRVKKLRGNYAMGTAGKISTYTWYTVRQNGKWKEVWRGQNSISCKVVREYAIPKEMYDSGEEGSGCSENY